MGIHYSLKEEHQKQWYNCLTNFQKDRRNFGTAREYSNILTAPDSVITTVRKKEMERNTWEKQCEESCKKMWMF